MFGIYQDKGKTLISDSVRISRKLARRDFSKLHGIPFGHLWELGYMVKAVA